MTRLTLLVCLVLSLLWPGSPIQAASHNLPARSVTPPDPFTKTSPADAVTSLTLPPTLTWASSGGAGSYEYCLDTSADTVCDTGWVSTGTATSVTIHELLIGTTYTWQVRAVNGAGSTEADSSVWWSFTTAVSAPGNFAKLSPAHRSTGVSIDPTLSWDHSPAASTYEYCIDTSADIVCDTGWISNGSSTSVSLTGLSGTTTYYWQVRGVNSSGRKYANSNAWWYFTTETASAPDAFTKTSPADASVDIAITPTLTWTASSGATDYETCLDADTDTTCDSGWVSAGNVTSLAVSGLANSTTYSWQVRAVNSTGNTEADGGTWWTFTTLPLPPLTFSKNSPANASTGVAADTRLQWNASTYASGYEICIDADTDTSCTSGWTDAGAVLLYHPGVLLPDTTYSWQVRAYNSAGRKYANSNTWWTFTTMPLPEGTTKASPTNMSTGVSLTPALLWTPGLYENYFDYCIDTSDNDTCDTSWVTTGGDIGITLSTLAEHTNYYWQVRACNEGGCDDADNGDWWSFETLTIPPASFNKSTPTNLSTGLSVTPTLIWAASAGASRYEYCLDTLPNGTCDTSWISTDKALTVTTATLLPLTTYYWQVRAVNDGGSVEANSGNWWHFTTRLPAPANFGKTLPFNRSVRASANPTLSWGTATYATSYEYCIDTVNNTACDTAWVSTGSSTSATIPLAFGTTYYWQVRAKNSSGSKYANSNTWWSFSTLNLPPGTFAKLSPADGTTLPHGSMSLSWTPSTGAAYYEFCMDMTDNNTCDGTWENVELNTTIYPRPIPGYTWYWQVRAVNPVGTTEASGSWWEFFMESAK